MPARKKLDSDSPPLLHIEAKKTIPTGPQHSIRNPFTDCPAKKKGGAPRTAPSGFALPRKETGPAIRGRVRIGTGSWLSVILLADTTVRRGWSRIAPRGSQWSSDRLNTCVDGHRTSNRDTVKQPNRWGNKAIRQTPPPPKNLQT